MWWFDSATGSMISHKTTGIRAWRNQSKMQLKDAKPKNRRLKFKQIDWTESSNDGTVIHKVTLRIPVTVTSTLSSEDPVDGSKINVKVTSKEVHFERYSVPGVQFDKKRKVIFGKFMLDVAPRTGQVWLLIKSFKSVAKEMVITDRLRRRNELYRDWLRRKDELDRDWLSRRDS